MTVAGPPVLGFTYARPFFAQSVALSSLMSRCLHCKHWEVERDGACRLCRLCLAISRIAGDTNFRQKHFEGTCEGLAGILGTLTSQVLLVPPDGRRNFLDPPAQSVGESLDSPRAGREPGRRRHRERGRSASEGRRSRDRRRRPETADSKDKCRLPTPPRVDLRGRGKTPSVSLSRSPRDKSRNRRRQESSDRKKRRRAISPGSRPEEKKEKEDREDPHDRVEKEKREFKSTWVPNLRTPAEPKSPSPRKSSQGGEAEKTSSNQKPLEPSPPAPPAVPKGGREQERPTQSSSSKGWKGAGKAPYSSGRPSKGDAKGGYSNGNWSHWGWKNWGWDSSWDQSYYSDPPKARKNRGLKSNQFIGKKIEERRAKAKAKAATGPLDRKSVSSESESGQENGVSAALLPPPGTVIAEECPEQGPPDVKSELPQEEAAPSETVKDCKDAAKDTATGSGTPDGAPGETCGA